MTRFGDVLWQTALMMLVAPFYAGLFVITAVGAALTRPVER
jgi:hypothetical protein